MKKNMNEWLNENTKLLNAVVRLVFTDGNKGDNAHVGRIVWIGKKYIELTSDRGNELIPHKNVIRIEIIRRKKMAG